MSPQVRGPQSPSQSCEQWHSPDAWPAQLAEDAAAPSLFKGELTSEVPGSLAKSQAKLLECA